MTKSGHCCPTCCNDDTHDHKKEKVINKEFKVSDNGS